MSEWIEETWKSSVRFASGGTKEMDVEAVWDAEDPLVVVLTFLDSWGEPMWEVSRDLLLGPHGGVRALPGGDIQVRYALDWIYLTLTGEDAPSCDVALPRWRVEAFLKQTLKQVPQGEEFIDVDAALEELLK